MALPLAALRNPFLNAALARAGHGRENEKLTRAIRVIKNSRHDLKYSSWHTKLHMNLQATRLTN